MDTHLTASLKQRLLAQRQILLVQVAEQRGGTVAAARLQAAPEAARCLACQEKQEHPPAGVA